MRIQSDKKILSDELGITTPVSLEEFEKMLPAGSKILSISEDGIIEVPYKKEEKMALTIKKNWSNRKLKSMFGINGVEICIADDDTVWLLDRNSVPYRWIKMYNLEIPDLPQD